MRLMIFTQMLNPFFFFFFSVFSNEGMSRVRTKASGMYSTMSGANFPSLHYDIENNFTSKHVQIFVQHYCFFWVLPIFFQNESRE